MVALVTLEDLHSAGHGLAAYCPTCARWAVVDVGQLVKTGQGARVVIGRPPRCRACGGVGEWQVRPPVPSIDPAHGYGERV